MVMLVSGVANLSLGKVIRAPRTPEHRGPTGHIDKRMLPKSHAGFQVPFCESSFGKQRLQADRLRRMSQTSFVV